MVGSDCSRMRLPQAVDEDGGDPRALVGAAGLLLDDRGQDRRVPPASGTAGPASAAARSRFSACFCAACIALTICWRVMPRSNL